MAVVEKATFYFQVHFLIFNQYPLRSILEPIQHLILTHMDTNRGLDFQPRRAVKPMYAGQNGFATGFTEPDQINNRNLQIALEAHAMGEFMIDYMKREVPDFETMKADVEKPPEDELQRIDRRLTELRKAHTRDLELLYAYQTQEYDKYATDQYLCLDNNLLSEDPNTSSTQRELEAFYDSDPTPYPSFQNHFIQLRYTYLTQLLSLQKSKQEHEANLAKLRRQRELMFPQSKEEWATKPQDVRLRVARFLVADPAKHERFLSDFGWAWRQVQPLLDVFKKDDAFAADVRGLLLSEQAVRDPRIARA
ncbi:hypothetical protein CPB84DRAFT_1789564 [Gymnopilus junonius]|uniref:Uncharacterized protein n=1 Tax=Gymnopilus junonius TaxID=109634 RepID=A0A9P5TJL3_GYMJU|nr:hypothetical protein CPB84DRAFT_1789564 [Gymnopilus junonius]